ncbi:2-succinyl-5-enolpyruvyl-6-hydroxy-3-cyclohexene-1-carboxylic-acid synthase [Candidatus Neptunochlamydia vexilliferae]|nr:2-succinyl-5-enolpyruvyl-6-hydroxy-3-cyclohexene-1-carboxylic-acid synthase [Candidatus Neptunochlamydia vexilliferae]
MKNDTATLNGLWARLLIKELVHHGVRSFCIAPGSRSSALVAAAARAPLAETFVHYDERGLGFHALGYAKSHGRPVAIIVTSGTAVGNLLPAVMEAHHDHIPLIILTADRPPELQDCGANQTSVQRGLFKEFVRWEGELPCPDGKVVQSYVGTTVSQMVSHASLEPRGPVHLNCQFRKPFFGKDEQVTSHQAQTSLSFGKRVVEDKEQIELAEMLGQYEKGVILVSGEAKEAEELSKRLQWPIFPDVLSPVRSRETASYYDLMIRAIGTHEDFAPNAVLQFGDRFVSSALYDWLSFKRPKVYCQIASHHKRKDPIHGVTHRVVGEVPNLPCYVQERSSSKWLDGWKELNELTAKGVAAYFDHHQELTEPHLFHRLEGEVFFFANSMVIRNADAFFVPEKGAQTFGNRGLSGIDGNIATVAGIARGCERPVTALIGDQAFLHDLSSLAQLKDLPVKLIVINNQGGDIFSFLPIDQDLFKPYFSTPHTADFKHAASLFGLRYENPTTIDELLEIPHGTLVEVKTKPGDNLKIHQEVLENLKISINRFNQPDL